MLQNLASSHLIPLNSLTYFLLNFAVCVVACKKTINPLLYSFEGKFSFITQAVQVATEK